MCIRDSNLLFGLQSQLATEYGARSSTTDCDTQSGCSTRNDDLDVSSIVSRQNETVVLVQTGHDTGVSRLCIDGIDQLVVGIIGLNTDSGDDGTVNRNIVRRIQSHGSDIRSTHDLGCLRDGLHTGEGSGIIDSCGLRNGGRRVVDSRQLVISRYGPKMPELEPRLLPGNRISIGPKGLVFRDSSLLRAIEKGMAIPELGPMFRHPLCALRSICALRRIARLYDESKISPNTLSALLRAGLESLAVSYTHLTLPTKA